MVTDIIDTMHVAENLPDLAFFCNKRCPHEQVADVATPVIESTPVCYNIAPMLKTDTRLLHLLHLDMNETQYLYLNMYRNHNNKLP